MLLTLSNLSALRLEVTARLNKHFEDFFSVKLTDETKKIKDVVGQIDARLFQSYTRPAVENLRSIIRTGISSANWQPGPTEKPKQPRRYVYEALLSLVFIHSQVSTTAPSMTSQVMSYFLEQASKEILEAFKQRSGYTLHGLMQATLDVEFVAQTLNQYTTKHAGEVQSAIYAELDKSTEHKDKLVLQNELPEMRALLKRLRENSRSEFACFKKARRPAERPQA
jgi:exocyst complex component 2